MNQNIIGGE